MWNCYLNNAHVGFWQATAGQRRRLLAMIGLLVTATAAQATIVYSLYESTDGTGAVAATVIAPSGLIQDTSDWYLSQIIPNVGNPLPNFDLTQPVAVLYSDPYCGYNYCVPGQAWVTQELNGYSNRLHFSLIQTVFNVPGPDLPIFDGLYSTWGDHDAYYNHTANCGAGECNWTRFRSLRITGAGNSVPEPGTLILMLGSLGLLSGVRRRMGRDAAECSSRTEESNRFSSAELG